MRFLICGLGSIGQRHVRIIQERLGGEADILAYRSRKLDLVISDGMEARSAKIEDHYGISSTDDFEKGLDFEPDAVFVTNPISLHTSVAQSAASRGFNVFVEKPLSGDWTGIDPLMKTAKENGVTGAVGYQLRFHPGLQEIRAHLDAGTIGRIIHASLYFGEYLPGMHPYEDYRTSHAARRDQGGGVILCLSHEIDYACWLFGDPVRVACFGGHLTGLELDVEDTASILYEFDASTHTFPVFVHLNFAETPPRKGCRIVGENGTIEWDYHRCSVSVETTSSGQKHVTEVTNFDRNRLFLDQFDDFVASCETPGREPVCSLAEGARSLRAALAAKRALETRTVVEMGT